MKILSKINKSKTDTKQKINKNNLLNNKGLFNSLKTLYEITSSEKTYLLESKNNLVNKYKKLDKLLKIEKESKILIDELNKINEEDSRNLNISITALNNIINNKINQLH